jgi:hypothetical protein
VIRQGFRVGGRSRGRFATPADFPLHDGTTPYPGYTYGVGVWDLSIVQGPFSVAPCQTLRYTIRDHLTAQQRQHVVRALRHHEHVAHAARLPCPIILG